MNGKVKSLHGVYKALGRDAFLAAAKMYSDHVQKTVEATLAEMESHWYGAEKTMTEADRMVSDFQIGYLTRESAEGLLAQERLQEKFAKNMNAVLNNVHFVRLECSCMSPNKSYAGEVLKEMHGAFVKTYGTDYLEEGEFEFVNIPAVIRSRNTGKLCLGIVTLDLGILWRTLGDGFPDAIRRRVAGRSQYERGFTAIYPRQLRPLRLLVYCRCGKGYPCQP